MQNTLSSSAITGLDWSVLPFEALGIAVREDVGRLPARILKMVIKNWWLGLKWLSGELVYRFALIFLILMERKKNKIKNKNYIIIMKHKKIVSKCSNNVF